MIDGTYISGTSNFYGRVHQVFEKAKPTPRPSFSWTTATRFSRAARNWACTATCSPCWTVWKANSPPGLRDADGHGCRPFAAGLDPSGRIELWLEMRLPDQAARTAILGQMLAGLAPSVGVVEVAPLVEATAGFTGADLKRLIEDGKNLSLTIRCAAWHFVRLPNISCGQSRPCVRTRNATPRPKPGAPATAFAAGLLRPTSVGLLDRGITSVSFEINRAWANPRAVCRRVLGHVLCRLPGLRHTSRTLSRTPSAACGLRAVEVAKPQAAEGRAPCVGKPL